MAKLVPEKTRPIIFDVGANVGQSILEFNNRFKEPHIHAFEPSPRAFARLKQEFESSDKLKLNQLAVGSTNGSQVLFENSHTELSSLLEPEVICGGTVVNRPCVDVITIDNYCQQVGIENVHILKVDTQGFDFEVLKGSKNLMSSGRIDLIFLEILFVDMYKDLPDFGEIYRFLEASRFHLVSFYKFYYMENRAAWTDALFARTLTGG